MAITIDTNPQEPLSTGNPAFAEISTDKRILVAGSVAEIEFSYATQLAAGSHGTLLWNGQEYRFDVVASPDDSGFELPAFNNTPTFQAFVAALAANYYINRDFTVVTINDAGPYHYKLVAREVGTAYTVVVSSSLNWSSGTSTPGVDDELAENFKATGHIYADTGSGFELITQVEGAWDNNDSSRIYLNAYLNALFSLSQPPIEFPGTGIGRWTREMTEMIIPYYVELREFYGEPPTFKNPTNWGTAANPKRAAKFQLTRPELSEIDVPGDYFSHAPGIGIITDQKEKIVLAGQTDYYYVYMMEGVSGNQSISKIDVYYKDGTTDLDFDVSNYQFTGARPAGFVEFAMDWSRILNLGGFTKPIEKVDVYHKATFPSPGVISEKVTVYFDHTQYENEHYFLFRNRSNGWSTIGFTGQLKKLVNTEKESAVLGDYSSNSYGDEFTYNHHFQYGFEVGTGVWSKRFTGQIVEFMNSDEVYILDGTWGDADASFRPVIIDAEGLSEIESSESYSFSGVFKFKNVNREI